jgi:hypothetical protein
MYVANGSWNIASTKLRPIREFCSLRPLRSTYSGMSSVAYGTIKMDSVNRNNASRPGNLNLAKAYPPRVDTARVIATVRSATYALLSRNWTSPAP